MRTRSRCTSAYWRYEKNIWSRSSSCRSFAEQSRGIISSSRSLCGRAAVVQRALAIRERTLGPDGPDVAVSLINYGLSLMIGQNGKNCRLARKMCARKLRLCVPGSIRYSSRPLTAISHISSISLGRGALVTPPLDTKLACLDRDHEEKISHRVGQPQVGECSLAMPLAVGHGVAEEAERGFPSPIGPAWPAELALAEAAAVVQEFRRRTLASVHVTLLHSAARSSQSLMQRRIAPAARPADR